MAEHRFTLYHSLTSVCSQKVRLTLAELDVEYANRVLDLKNGDQFQTEYLTLNPNGVVPTLVDQNNVVTNSNTIMRHLCDQFPEHALSVSTAHSGGEHVDWLECADRLHTAVHAITYVCVNRERLLALSKQQLEQRLQNIPDPARSHRLRLIVEEGFASAPVNLALNTIAEILPRVLVATQRQQWLVGDRVTLADLGIFPFVHRLRLLGLDQLWVGDDLAGWHSRFLQRTSFKIAIETLVPESAIKNFAACGQIALPQLRSQLQ